MHTTFEIGLSYLCIQTIKFDGSYPNQFLQYLLKFHVSIVIRIFLNFLLEMSF